MEKLVIDRARWLRGEGSGESYLLRESDGKMCCLGFYCLARGLTAEEIKGIKTPTDVTNPVALVPLVKECELCGGHVHQTEVCSSMMTVNDDQVVEDDRREEELTRLFGELGVGSVEFVN